MLELYSFGVEAYIACVTLGVGALAGFAVVLLDLVLGISIDQVAAPLFISQHTVQQHLKSIFDKTGVRSRRDLVGRIFYTHYEPRFRDNERRTAASQPLRGGPASASPDST